MIAYGPLITPTLWFKFWCGQIIIYIDWLAIIKWNLERLSHEAWVLHDKSWWLLHSTRHTKLSFTPKWMFNALLYILLRPSLFLAMKWWTWIGVGEWTLHISVNIDVLCFSFPFSLMEKWRATWKHPCVEPMQASQKVLNLQAPYSWIVENLFHQYSIAKVGQLNLKADKPLVRRPFSTQAQKHISWDMMFRSLVYWNLSRGFYAKIPSIY